MKGKGIWIAVVVIIILVVAVLAFGGSKSASSPTPVAEQGSVVFAVTDAAADIQNVSEIRMQVNKVEMHSAANDWVTVSDKNQEFDLLRLKAQGKWQVAAQEQVSAGSYDQVRMMVTSVDVVKTDGSTVAAKVPSGELKLATDVNVASGQTSTVAVDIIGDASLHATGNGKYIFAPVVHAVSRENTEASVASDDSVTISGGSVDSDINAGMDVNGEVKNDFKLDSNAQLNIETSGIITIGSSHAESSSAASGNLQLNVGGGASNSNSNDGGVKVNVGGNGSGVINY